MRQFRLPVIMLALSLIEAPYVLGATITYDVSHTFSFTPTGGVISPLSYDFGVSAQASPGGTPDANSGSVLFGTGGGTSTQLASSTGLFSSAVANSSATLNPFSIGGPVSGMMSSDGSFVALPGGTCCAISSAAILIDGGTPATHGSANYTPEMTMGGSDGVGEGEGTEHDPIDFQVTDLKTGAITTGTLFDVSSDLQGTGSWSWGSGAFTLDAPNFDFSIEISSPFTVQQGTADLQVRKGTITTSDGTGMFAGIFPAVGSPGNFSVPFSNSFSIDYDLGNFNGDPLDVQFTLSNSGSACLAPEPATIVPMGLAVVGLLLVEVVARRAKTGSA